MQRLAQLRGEYFLTVPSEHDFPKTGLFPSQTHHAAGPCASLLQRKPLQSQVSHHHSSSLRMFICKQVPVNSAATDTVLLVNLIQSDDRPSSQMNVPRIGIILATRGTGNLAPECYRCPGELEKLCKKFSGSEQRTCPDKLVTYALVSRPFQRKQKTAKK